MVSIIIPAYNVEKYIERCVRSAMNQTMKEIEIIVVNDGSTDKTKTIIENMALKDKRIKIINKKNGGLSSARNTGISQAKGEYIQHLDGDDWIERETCEELYKLAKENDLDIIISDFYKDYDNGKILKIESFKFEENIVLDSNICLKELNESNTNVNIWTKFIRRRLYIDNSIQHLEGINLGEDLVTTPKLLAISKKIMKKKKAYYHYIFNPNSITNDKFSEKIGELFLCFDELEKFFLKKKKDSFYIDLLKANHLATFFYTKPLFNKSYLRNYNKFEKYLETVDKLVIKKANKRKKYLYYIFRNIKDKRKKIKLIKILYGIKNRIGSEK